MAGDIFVSEDQHWSVASWAFNWAAEFLAERVEDEQVRSWIREVLDANIGALVLDKDFSEEGRKQILDLLRTDLVPDAEERLPHDLSDRPGALKVLRQLADMARDVAAR